VVRALRTDGIAQETLSHLVGIERCQVDKIERIERIEQMPTVVLVLRVARGAWAAAPSN
jgi:hypothetical protein